MSIFNQRRLQIQELQRQTREFEGKVEEFKVKVDGLAQTNRHLVEVNELLVKDILSLQEGTSTYKGNDYIEYARAVQAISDKYNAYAEWGMTQTGIIIDLRAAFILGDGLKISHTTQTRAEAQRELDFCRDFLDFNDLDREMAHEIAKEAEIEGKIALTLLYDKSEFGKDPTGKPWPGIVSTRYISWLSKGYTVTADPQDYLWYKELSWMAGTKATRGASLSEDVNQQPQPAGKLGEDEFVYKKFGGRLNNPNEAQPKIMKCLTQVDRLDKALRDLREINHLFASPTPNFKVADAGAVSVLASYIKETNWKIGKAIVHSADFSLVSPDSSGVQNLIDEIELCVKIISSTTGIPIHYLGFLDLLKNRATGENTRELMMVVTTKERQTWIGAYEELITKAMKMMNAKAFAQLQEGKKLDPSKVKVDIPLISEEQWTHLEKVLIPAAIGGIVSKEFVASQIPGLNMEDEQAKQQAAQQSEAEALKAEVAKLQAESAAKDQAATGGNGGGLL